MAEPTGLEPATSDVTGRRSNQLNYVPAGYRPALPAYHIGAPTAPSRAKLVYSVQTEVDMLLKIETKKVEPDITLVQMAGRIMLGPESREVEALVNDLLKQNEKKLIFDLSGVEYVDSTGIGTITLCFSLVKKASGALRVAGAQGKVWHLFKLTKLDSVLSFYPTVEAARQDFGTPTAS